MLVKGRSRKPIEEKIAETILAAALGGIVTATPVATVVGLVAAAGAGYYLFFRKSDFNREVKRLQKKGFVALTKTESGWTVKILGKGKNGYKKTQLRNLKLPTGQQWDKKWRLFVFDIPEKMRFERDYLRRKLKQLGLYNIQRSVFAYPYDCRKELEFISNYYDLEKYTTYAEVSYTDIDWELTRRFKALKILS